MLTFDRTLIWQAIKNATLFTRPKTLSGSQARFEFSHAHRKLSITAALDAVSVVTTVDVLSVEGVDESVTWFVDQKELSALERDIRNHGGQTVTFEVDPDSLHDAQEPEFWEALDDVYQSINSRWTKLEYFDTAPELMTQLSRLEPKGQHAISWLPFQHNQDLCLAFRYGPNTVGVLVPLDRDSLEPEALEYLWR